MRYCEGRVASLPAEDREEATDRCAMVFSEFAAAHDRVQALKRLAELEAWLRLRTEPILTQSLDGCAEILAEKEPGLQRDAHARLTSGRESLRARQSESRKKSTRGGDLMNPF